MKKFRSITTKILLITLVSSILLTGILITISHRMTTTTLEDLNSNYANRDISIYSEYLAQWFHERFREIETYTHEPVIASMDFNRIRPYLKGEVQRKGDIFSFFIISDNNGNTVTTLENKDISPYKLLLDMNTGNKKIYIPEGLNYKEGALCIVSLPILDDLGNTKGILAGGIKLENLYSVIQDFKVDSIDSYTYIVDKNGVILVHPDKALIMNSTLIPSLGIVDEMSNQRLDIAFQDKGSGVVKYIYQGVSSFAYFREIPYTDEWRIVTKIPEEYARQSIDNINSRLLSAGMLVIIISAIASILISRTISKPIIKLKDSIVKSTKSNFITKVEIESYDEVGILTESFNNMLDVIGELTYYDPLTGLPGRKIFEEQLEMAISHSKRNNEGLAIMMIGIDKFKYVNDVYGLAIGDLVLRMFAKRIKESLREEDIVCRVTGDEFAIFFPEIESQKQVVKFAEELLGIIKKPYNVNSEEDIYITASGGLSFYPKDGDNRETLIKNSNIALHRAKQRGGGTYQLYSSIMKEELLEQLEIEKMMVHAIEREEFYLHYQPIINTKNMEIIGMEALLRWEHPVLGAIEPNKFIPIAEENGGIIALGRFALREAALQNKEWQKRGYKKIFVSVNISLRQFQDQNFVNMVKSVLEETGLEPQYLGLEITESIVMENEEYTLRVLKELKDMGVKTAIDDFGTGYSSLAYLDKFTINALKIDKSFILNICNGENKRTIASTIIDLGHNLGLKVTAEGVESKEQLQYLIKNGCDSIQGYYFSRPINKEEAEKMLIENSFSEVAATIE